MALIFLMNFNVYYWKQRDKKQENLNNLNLNTVGKVVLTRLINNFPKIQTCIKLVWQYLGKLKLKAEDAEVNQVLGEL